jgi:hypothetical protein
MAALKLSKTPTQRAQLILMVKSLSPTENDNHAIYSKIPKDLYFFI